MAAAAALLLALAACDAQDIILPADAFVTDPGSGVADPGHPLDPGPESDPGPQTPDAGPPRDPGGIDGSIQLCIGNQDGRIDADEMPVVLGAAPGFRANAAGTLVAADPFGTTVEGEPVWDFRNAPGDVRTPMFVAAPGGSWFADRFPGATFVSPLSAQDPSILGVYQAGEAGVSLMGIASVEADPPGGRTIVVYDSPVKLFAFPLAPGQEWSVETKFKDALLAGIPNAGKEVYHFRVDGPGTVMLPDLSVRGSLRMTIRTEQTFVVSPVPGAIVSLQYLFVHECIGEVARLTGPAGESPWAGRAREVRYLGL